MYPDEQARLDTIGELLDRTPHQVGAGCGMDRHIFVGAAHAINGIDRDANQSTRASEPEFGLILRLALAAACRPQVPENELQLVHPLLCILCMKLVLGAHE